MERSFVYNWGYRSSVLRSIYLHNLLKFSPLLTVYLHISVGSPWCEPLLSPISYNLDVWDRSVPLRLKRDGIEGLQDNFDLTYAGHGTRHVFRAPCKSA